MRCSYRYYDLSCLKKESNRLQTQYDLATQTDTMLEYQIDTYGGKLSEERPKPI